MLDTIIRKIARGMLHLAITRISEPWMCLEGRRSSVGYVHPSWTTADYELWDYMWAASDVDSGERHQSQLALSGGKPRGRRER